MSLVKEKHIYNGEEEEDSLENMYKNNKLFATFTTEDSLEDLVATVQSRYGVTRKDIFAFSLDGTSEFLITYNVEDLDQDDKLPSTIILHRKKETGTLFTIDAMNIIIKKLNGGVVDKNFPVNWENYRFSVLTEEDNQLKQQHTKIRYL